MHAPNYFSCEDKSCEVSLVKSFSHTSCQIVSKSSSLIVKLHSLSINYCPYPSVDIRGPKKTRKIKKNLQVVSICTVTFSPTPRLTRRDSSTCLSSKSYPVKLTLVIFVYRILRKQKVCDLSGEMTELTR